MTPSKHLLLRLRQRSANSFAGIKYALKTAKLILSDGGHKKWLTTTGRTIITDGEVVVTYY